jgi:hypothetical protein
MQFIKPTKKLYRFGKGLIVLNIVYCWLMVMYFAVSKGEYVFTSKYFFAAALLTLLYFKVQTYLK